MPQDSSLLFILFRLVDVVIELFVVVLLIYVIISWLFAFDIIRRGDSFVSGIYEFCRRLTDPVLRPLRRIIPPIAGVDLSVLILMIAIQVLILPLWWWFYGVLIGRAGIG